MRRIGYFGPVIAVVCLALLTTLYIDSGTLADAAEDANALLKQFNSDLRRSQNDMFAGKSEQAVESLETLKSLLDRVAAVDPNNPQLKAARSKYDKLLKDLERRTGRDLGAGTTTVSAGSETKLPPKPDVKPMPNEAPAAPEVSGTPQKGVGATATAAPQDTKASEDMPYHARRPYQQAENSIARVDSYIQRLLDPSYTGSKEQLISNATRSIEEASDNLEDARQKAAEKGVAAHPKFDELAGEIETAQKKLDAASGEYAQMAATAAASADEVNHDVDVLRQSYQRYLPLFQKASGAVPYYNDLKTLDELIRQIEAFEADDQAPLQGQLDDFAAKYGATPDEVDRKAEEMGYSGEGRASYPYQELTQGIENIRKTRALTADDILRRAKDKQANASQGLHDFHRIEGHATIRAWGEMAARFDPQNPRVEEFNSSLDAWIRSDLAALNAKIDRAAWPQQAADSPGDAAQLAGTAKAFLQRAAETAGAEGKEPRSVVAVVVTGPWRIFKRNILGEPIQYGLPVMVGELWESDKGMDRLRAYQMSMLTEEYKGVKMAPPFIGAAVGDSWYVRPAAIESGQ